MKILSMQRSPKRSKGFTLLEMLLVGVIIAVIGGIAARQYGTVSASNKANEVVLSVRNIHAATSSYNQDKGDFPTDTAALISDGYLANNGDKTPWGSKISLTQPSGGTYTITVSDVPSTALCLMLYNRLNVTVNSKAGEKVVYTDTAGNSGADNTGNACNKVVVTYPVD